MIIDRFSICHFTLLTTPFEDFLDAVAGAGVPGVGICEATVPEGWDADRVRRELGSRGLLPTICLPALLSPLPLVLFPGPDAVADRERELVESIRFFGAIGAESVAILTGPAQARDLDEARALSVASIARLADVAAAAGTRLALEPIHRDDHENWSLIWDLPGTLGIVDEIASPSLGVLVDSFHLWDTDDFHGWIRRAGTRVAAVHVNDRGSDHRSWADRRVPGSGLIDLAGMILACEDAGFRRHYDCEIFSDDGSFGVADYPDSLWKRPAPDVVGACVEGFEAAFTEANRRKVVNPD